MTAHRMDTICSPETYLDSSMQLDNDKSEIQDIT